MKKNHIYIVILVLFFLLPLFSVAAVITVPGDYSTIQAAINVATNGDEIIVSPGTYYENINFDGRNLILRSTDPTDPSVVASTIINGNHNGTVVVFSGTELTSCTLSGFTITNGYGFYGGGIQGGHTLATIQYNHIGSNYAQGMYYPLPVPAAGAGIYGCDGTIQNNIISRNWFGPPGGLGSGLCSCDGIIQNNTIYDNDPHGGVLYDCNGTIRNCIIWGESWRDKVNMYGATPSYCCIKDWAGGGRNNFTGDPRMVNPGGGNFHLRFDSPCIDAGCYIPELIDDFDGDPRGYDGTPEPRGDGSDYDIGADEYIIVPTPTPTPSPTPCVVIPVDSWSFEAAPEGWSYRTAVPPPDIPAWSHATSVLASGPGAIGLNSPADETTDYYGSWDNYSGDPNIPVIGWADNSVWRTIFTMSTDKPDPGTVPSIRLRFVLNHMKATSSIQVLPGDWVSLGQRGVSTTDYKLYFRPPIVDNGMFLAFDLLDNGQPFGMPCDGTVYLEEVVVDRYDLTDPCFHSDWTAVSSYSGSELHSWSHSSAGVSFLTNVNGYSKLTEGLEQNTTLAQTRAFGAWSSPSDEVDLITDQFYRAKWRLACEDSTVVGANRIRIHSQDFRYSSYLAIDRDINPDNSGLPPSIGRDYYIYAEFPGTPTVDQLLLAWDLYDFDPGARGWAMLTDVTVSRRDLP